MKKLSSYQKLKAKNIALRKQITILLDMPDSFEAMQIKGQHELGNALEKAIWFGSRQRMHGPNK